MGNLKDELERQKKILRSIEDDQRIEEELAKVKDKIESKTAKGKVKALGKKFLKDLMK